ncbi:hypothetical protein KPL78_15345 [Roseomonas sp. HJA6]|uniref:Uncharacterized protein n=1 Tax=Roseomonas alba TaxID=2846776 RepID=A0ABS7AAC0_9PROT|nr:hypothetical protein [Neoroseomonas alba]MBW6399236.1 hypothetical protein [Neoroseomonas alba]
MMADFGDIFGGTFAALLAVAFAVALLRLGIAGFEMTAPHDAEAVPILRLLALGTGTALGVALVAAEPHTDYFLPDRIFAGDGPWSISLLDLLGRHALPQLSTLQALPDLMLAFDGLAAFTGWIGLLGLVQGAIMTQGLWHGRAQRRAYFAFLLLALHIALLLQWTAHLTAWFAAQLNVWIIALALVLFQRWRYRPHHAASH